MMTACIKKPLDALHIKNTNQKAIHNYIILIIIWHAIFYLDWCLFQSSFWIHLVVSSSHLTATLFIVPFILLVPGSDLGSSYVAKATDFYWVMPFPVGTGVSHQPACTGFASHSAAWRVHSDIHVWQSNKSWHGTHTPFWARLA